MTATANDSQLDEALINSIVASVGLPRRQVLSAVELLQAGNTIPFIARYRKEVTGGLDEIQLRSIEDAMETAIALAERKSTVLNTIQLQGLLTDALRNQIESCDTMATLEVIYAPFKPKRRTRAMIAKERGLQPLADCILLQKPLSKSRSELLKQFVDVSKDVPDPETALAGAMDIIAEHWADDPNTRLHLSNVAIKHGDIVSSVKRGKADDIGKFEQYADRAESIAKLPGHRLLAMLRGQAEGVLKVGLQLDDDQLKAELKSQWIKNRQSEFAKELSAAADDCYERLLVPATTSTVLQQLKDRADEEAIAVFGKNLVELLMSPPAGPRVTIGIDPGFRTGCKVAVVDATGKFLGNTTVYPTPPKEDIAGAEKVLLAMIQKFAVELIAIGNGTASRETESFVRELIRREKLDMTAVMVSESGASIYSASELAAHEFPDLDITVRGAISIARRLQDPLAELVKTDPKSIGVGQYQHDVNQPRLRKCLDRIVQSCVNSVGVDVNTASVPLLAQVAGIGPKLAEGIVAHRDKNGRFHSRRELAKVPKLGAKAMQQAAGFLRIANGSEPLDDSAVHPESYPVVESMSKRLGVPVATLVGNGTLTAKLQPNDFVTPQFGLPTIRDILSELAKPGRDPRKEFRVVRFDDKIHSVDDLKPGMHLEGVITNVTHFGAFVDLGVHQDGLIHISQLSNEFVRDPNEVVKVGDIVRVKVLEVDSAKKRISVSKKAIG